ncbi:MFS transporter [Desertihabitans aurantiacus]|uniref:MFS transporter n=1 Tax=Desertihabitans aurantiacus TaxID=2282477 RepID=UPI000DF738DB|nr:MFS transporter [Desertihabitans aurantiacus]
MEERRRPAREVLRGLVLPVFVPSFLFSLGTGASTPVILVAALTLGYGQAAAAALVASLALAAVLGSGPSGLIIARTGEVRSMLGATALAVVGLVTCLVTLTVGGDHPASRPAFAVAVVLIALAEIFFGLARQTLVAEHVPPHVRARAMSTFGGVHRAGRLVGPVVGSGVIALTSVAGGFWVQLVAVLLAAAVVVAVGRSPGRRLAPHTTTGDAAAVQQVAYRSVALVLVGVLALALARANRDVLLPLWGTELGLDASLISLVFAAVTAVELVMFVPAGTIMDRFGRAAVAVPCLLGMAVGFWVLPLAGTPGYLVGSLLVGLGNGLGAGIVMTLGADLSPEGGRARFLGWWTGLVQLGRVAGPGMVSLGTLLGGLAATVQLTGAIALVGAVWFVGLRLRRVIR